MGSPYVDSAATFLIQTLFGIYVLIVLLRFLLQLVRADFYNPISQFIVKATQPPLRPMRRYIPGVAGIDVATLVLLLALQVVELWLILAVVGHSAGLLQLLVLSVSELLKLTIDVFFYAILIQVIISWVNPGLYNPVTSLLYSLTEPVLRPARRMLPPFGGLDFSPFVVMIVLQLALLLVVAPIRDLAGATL